MNAQEWKKYFDGVCGKSRKKTGEELKEIVHEAFLGLSLGNLGDREATLVHTQVKFSSIVVTDGDEIALGYQEAASHLFDLLANEARLNERRRKLSAAAYRHSLEWQAVAAAIDATGVSSGLRSRFELESVVPVRAVCAKMSWPTELVQETLDDMALHEAVEYYSLTGKSDDLMVTFTDSGREIIKELQQAV